MRTIETPASRSSDPITSYLAEKHVNCTGLRGRQQRQATAAVKCYPGRTSAELAATTGLCRFMLGRRLSECETAGAVCRGDHRQCTISGRQAVTWLVGAQS